MWIPQSPGSGLADPDAPHVDDDQSVEADEQQVDAEEQEVQHIAHVAPHVLQLSLLLQVCVVGSQLPHVPADLT